MTFLSATNLPPALNRNERARLEAYVGHARIQAAQRTARGAVWMMALIPVATLLCAIAVRMVS